MGLHSNGNLLSLPTNLRLGLMSMEVANTLASYDMTTITAIKIVIVQSRESKYDYYKGVLSQKSSRFLTYFSKLDFRG
jgi:hypothetical protein